MCNSFLQDRLGKLKLLWYKKNDKRLIKMPEKFKNSKIENDYFTLIEGDYFMQP